MSKTSPSVLAIDIGGTKIRAGVFDCQRNCLHQSDFPTDVSKGRDAVINSIQYSLYSMLAWARSQSITIAGIGVSTAGVVNSEKGEIVCATEAIPQWQGTLLASILNEMFDLPVIVENDVKAALLGQLLRLPAMQKKRVVMLTLGTGLGGAMLVNGQLISGSHFVAGHFGRMKMPSPWAQDEIVSVESLVSGTGLANIANHLAKQQLFTNGKDVIEALKRHDEIAQNAIGKFSQWLALVLENIYWSIDPDLILLGGGLIDAQQHWWHELTERLHEKQVPVQVIAASLGNDAGIYGAADLMLTHLESAENMCV